jgi:hypothetical protein
MDFVFVVVKYAKGDENSNYRMCKSFKTRDKAEAHKRNLEKFFEGERFGVTVVFIED